MHVVLLAMRSLQPCAMSFGGPQQTQKARSLIARFCDLAKSEHPASVRKRLPRCRSFPCIDVFARQLSHPHPGAHSPQACCPAQHLSTQPDPHLSPIPHFDFLPHYCRNGRRAARSRLGRIVGGTATAGSHTLCPQPADSRPPWTPSCRRPRDRRRAAGRVAAPLRPQTAGPTMIWVVELPAMHTCEILELPAMRRESMHVIQ